jgi:hypothetical protein
MPIPNTGFVIHLRRVRQEKRASKKFPRTVGQYRCFWNGTAIAGLEGQIVERGGPGDNTDAVGDKQDRRIAKGTYPLAFQSGTKYATQGYSSSSSHTALKRPGLLLKNTGQRDAILIHPGMDYVWSVGCLNPCSALTDAKSAVDFADSRKRVIAIIDAMRAKIGNGFPKAGGAPVPGAVIVIDGEP